MTENSIRVKKISSMINAILSEGIVPDKETLDFIKSGYGMHEPDEISSFIEGGDDSGAVIEMLSYPEDSFREAVERFIPPEGLSADELKSIEDLCCKINEKIYIIISRKKIFLTPGDSHECRKRFIHRLYLNLPMNYLTCPEISTDIINTFSVKAYLRKKKFISIDENYQFLSDLINNYQSAKNISAIEFTMLLNTSADLLNGSGKRAFDILSEKKYYFENAISESEEFARLLKTYSMEFIMLKRIQPPLISIDEARTMIRRIDRLTSIVFGIIIPSVQNIFLDS